MAVLIETGEASLASHRNRPPMPRASFGPRLVGGAEPVRRSFF